MKRKTRLILGIVLRVFLAIYLMTVILTGSYLYWYYKTNLDFMYFVASYLGFGLCTNIAIISWLEESISRFRKRMKRKKKKQSGMEMFRAICNHKSETGDNTLIFDPVSNTAKCTICDCKFAGNM